MVYQVILNVNKSYIIFFYQFASNELILAFFVIFAINSILNTIIYVAKGLFSKLYNWPEKSI